MDLPIICTLSEAELRERKDTILASIHDAVISKAVISGGYRYEFAKQAITLQNVQRMVQLEQQCCRFLSFEVTEGEQTFWLNVTGPPGALDVIGDFFG